MAVPDTNTFSLQDVVDEVNPTTDDLVDAIADADSGKYDGTYYTAPATSLLEFRNYGALPTGMLIVIAINGDIDDIDACAYGGSYNNKWHDGAGTFAVVNDTIYNDVNLTTAFIGNNDWFHDQNGDRSYEISSTGKVLDVVIC